MRNTTDVVALSDEQLEIIMTAARPLEPAHRSAFLVAVARELAAIPREQRGADRARGAARSLRRARPQPRLFQVSLIRCCRVFLTGMPLTLRPTRLSDDPDRQDWNIFDGDTQPVGPHL